MSLFSGVLAISSAKRMFLYIEEYGLSIRRVSTIFGIIVILTSLFLLLTKCIFTNLKLLKAIGISLTLLITIFSFVNLDKTVTSYNVKRYMSQELVADIKYLHELTYTSVPDVLELYEFATETADELYEAKTINEMRRFFAKKQQEFDDRDLFAYTLDNIVVQRAFDRLSMKD